MPLARRPSNTEEGATKTFVTDKPRAREDGLDDAVYRDQADFRHAIRRFLRSSEHRARAEKVTPQQHALLLTVRGHPSYPNVTIGDIAQRLQIRHHSASLLVSRGVQRGIVAARADDVDRRRVFVSLTAEGQAILERITLANRQELKQLGGALFRDSLRRALGE